MTALMEPQLPITGINGLEPALPKVLAAGRLLVAYDSDPINPVEDAGEWELFSFSRRHRNHCDPEIYIKRVDRDSGDAVPANIGLARRLKCGTAFWLSYYEHGMCDWSLLGEGRQCQWDSARLAGILLWKGKIKDLPKTYEEREKWARGIVEEYTKYCNGQAYGYSLVRLLPSFSAEGKQVGTYEEDIDASCWGFTESDHMFNEIREHMRHNGIDPDELEITGDAKDLAAYHDLDWRKSHVAG